MSFSQEEPKKVCFNYDLFLNLEGNPPVNHLRCEKLTFNNPTRDFRRKLLKAGGVSGVLWDVFLLLLIEMVSSNVYITDVVALLGSWHGIVCHVLWCDMLFF